MKVRPSALAWTTAAALAVWGCGNEGSSSSPEAAPPPELAASAPRVVVYAVNYPLAYFADRLGGDSVEVVFPAPPGVDPAYWSPEAQEILDFQNADLILLNGADYAKWIGRASLPTTLLVNTGAGFEDQWLELDQGPVHSHGPEGEHTHKGYAFTVWLDPQLAVAQAEAIAEALIDRLPDQAQAIQAELEALRTDWQALDDGLRAATATVGEQPVLFSHPVYQYLESRYGLNAESVHWQPEAAPTDEQWRDLAATLERHPAGWMIWEGAPLPDVESRLAAMGVESVVFETAANTPAAGDLLSVMQNNVRELARIEPSE